MSEQNSKLNPAIRTTTIGVRILREIKIYPLSIGEQKELADIIIDAMVAFSKENENTISNAYHIVGMISDNLSRIITCVSDEKGEDVIKDITNDQALDIAEIVYEMNYGGNSEKKFKNLVNKIMKKES
jgi:hypothetical protein